MMSTFGYNPNERHSRDWVKSHAEGWQWRNADNKDKTLVEKAGKLAFWKDGRVHVSSQSIRERLDRGLMIREN